jgi:pimeloyl-[acyl-carrier protein] synthase
MTDNNLLWQPFRSKYLADPYPMYKRLRSEDPVHLAQTKEFIVTRYQDVKSILKSDKFLVGNRLEWLKRGIHYLENKDQDLSAIYDAVNCFLLMLNPPDHEQIRNFINAHWDDEGVDDIIGKSITYTLAQIKEGYFDAVDTFAQVVPVLTICNILGIESQDYRLLKQLGFQMTK